MFELEQLIAANPPAARAVVENALEQPIAPNLPKPLVFQAFVAKPPPSQKRKNRELLRQFDPVQPQNQPPTNDRDVVLTLFSDLRQEGEEKGRRYILWRITRDLENLLWKISWEKFVQTFEHRFMRKTLLGRCWNTSETDQHTWIGQTTARLGLTGFLTQNFGSNSKKQNVWTLTTSIALQPNGCLKVFSGLISRLFLTVSHFLEQGPLPDWLRNLARGGHAMFCLDTFRDNLCLWRCIAVHQGARRDRSTHAARLLAKGFYNFLSIPNDALKTSLDQLDDVEKFVNKNVNFSDWLGIRVCEPERQNDEVFWQLRRNAPAKIKKHFNYYRGFQRARFFDKRYFKTRKNFCLPALSRKVYKSLQPSKTFRTLPPPPASL